MKQRASLQIAAPVLAIGVAVLVSGLMLSFTEYSAFDVFRVIGTEGFSKIYLIETVNRAAPYYISGCAVAVGFKMNLFNIGVEGQYKLAALLAAAAGAAVTLPAPLHVLLIMVVAMVVGAAWASIPGVLKATRGVSEVISSIMLNAIALGLSAYMLGRWLRAPASVSPVVGTKPLADSARLPTLNPLLNALGLGIPDANRVQSYIFVAAAVGIAFYVIIWRTRFGYDLRASGSNPEAATASGVDAKRMIITAMLLSGGFAGLIGLNNIMGQAGRYTDVSVVSGLGFTGIAIALLGRNHPVGIALAALLWAFMDAVQTPLSNEGLPKQITAIMQGITVLSVVIAYEVVRRAGARQQAAALRRDDDGGAAAPGPEVAPA
ncbi:MAG: ABC transporter permease [Acidimicrobiales bacterium]|nr:ABC transporter permease [Acidimicrobiales bacterium]HRW37779.1 ABC transporter permease [Aquihabitans sp.]